MTTNYTGVIVIRKHLENSVVLRQSGNWKEWTICRLYRYIEIMEDEMLRQLLTYNVFDEFGKEGEKRDRAVIVKIIRTKTRLLQQRSDIGELHLIRKDTRGKRQVHYSRDRNGYVASEALEKGSGTGIARG